nr:hypothetical protein [Tanacetum cinerariifolium]
MEQMTQLTAMCEMVCQIVQKKQEEKRIEEEQAASARYWKIPACCDDDDDYDSAIAPILSTEETENSLSMGDEHLDTIPATKSDEVIKFIFEDLVLIPSEFEGIPDTMCDVHFVNNPTPLEAKDHVEIVINSNDDISSSDDDSLHEENIEYVEASPHDSELVSLEAAEIVIPEVEKIEDGNLREKLLNVHLLIANIEALKDNPTQSSELLTKSSSTSPNSFLEETNTFHNSLPEFENFYFDLGEISSGSTTTHFDISLSEYDPFIFDFTHEEFADDLAHIISPPKYDRFYFRDLPDPGELMSVLNSRIHENLPSATSVNLPIEDDYSRLLAYVQEEKRIEEEQAAKARYWKIPTCGDENIEYVEASPHDSELVSLEATEIVIPEVEEIEDDNLCEKLLNVHLLIANIEALKYNPTQSSEFLTKSSSTSLNSFLEETNTFHNSFPEFENFYFDLGEISGGSTTTHSDTSLSEYDSFIFEEFVDELAHIISPPEYDRFYFWNLPDPGELMGPHKTFQCQPTNEDYYHEQNSCYNSNSFGFDHCQPPQYTVNHPIFDAHNDLLSSRTTLMEQMMQLTSMCEMVCQIFQKKQEEKRIEEEQVAKTRYWKIPACCDDDDDYNSTITLVLSTEEPVDSLSMGDEHLDTIPATESDEVIKSSVEDLVLIPSESKGILDTMCDVHLVNNPTPLEAKDDFEISLNSNDDISSSDDDSLYNENIEFVEASPHDSELSSSISPKSLLEETNTFHNSLLEFENFYFDLEEINSGSTTTHFDFSLSEYDSFTFDLSNDQCPPIDKSDFASKEFADKLVHIISPPEYNRFYF